MSFELSLSYDDVLLKPKYSEVTSRSMVDVSVDMPKGFKFELPFIPANMKSVVGFEMAYFILQNKGLVFLHRFDTLEEQVDILKRLQAQPGGQDVFDHVGVSVGVKEEDKKSLEVFAEMGVKLVCIDIAHGDSKLCVDMTRYIAENYPNMLLVSGNVATGEGARRLWEAGADVVKVGIGPSAVCTTRVEAGAGVPQLTAIMSVAQERNRLITTGSDKWRNRKLSFIADGGIKNPSDVVKSLCFADMCMIGNLFSRTEEAPSQVVQVNGVNYKEYAGSSTHRGAHTEGVVALVEAKGTMNKVVTRLMEGLKSGASYQGAFNLTQLKVNPSFVRMTSSGLRESHPHDVDIIR